MTHLAPSKNIPIFSIMLCHPLAHPPLEYQGWMPVALW